MMIGDRLRKLRSHKKLSQGDIEKRTGLLRCYLSRVENGHTVPTIETLEKIARALEISMYQLFYGHEEAPDIPSLAPSDPDGRRRSGLKEVRLLRRLPALLEKMSDADRSLLFAFASRAAKPSTLRPKARRRPDQR